MTDVIAEAFVSIRPDFTKFTTELRAKTASAVKAASSKVKIGSELDANDLKKKVERAAKTARSGVIITTDLQSRDLKSKVKAAAKAAETSVKIKPDVDIDRTALKTEGEALGKSLSDGISDSVTKNQSSLLGALKGAYKDTSFIDEFNAKQRSAAEENARQIQESYLKSLNSLVSDTRNATSRSMANFQSDYAPALRNIVSDFRNAGNQSGNEFGSGLSGSVRGGVDREISYIAGRIESGGGNGGRRGGLAAGGSFDDSFRSALDRTERRLSSFGRGVTFSGLAAGVAALVNEFVALTAAIAPAAGALAAIPAAFSVAGAGFGTLFTGFLGFGDAFKKSAKAAGGAAVDLTAKTRAVESALKGVTSAQRGIDTANKQVILSTRDLEDAEVSLFDAQKDLTAAQQTAAERLAGYNLRLQESAAAQESAQLGVAEAQERLNQLQQSGTATQLELQRAQLDVTQAQFSYQDAVNSTVSLQKEANDAQQKGVDGAQEVIDAQKKVHDATEGVSDAQDHLTDSVQGVTDAQQELLDAQKQLADAQADLTKKTEGGSAAQSAAAAAFAKLSPEAQKVVLAIKALSGQWNDLHKTVQDHLFAGIGEEVTNLANVSFPTLKTGMSLVADGFNSVFKSASRAAQTPLFQGAVAKTFDTTARSTRGLADATGPLTTGLANLVVAGLPLVQRFADFVNGGLKSAGAFLTTAAGAQKMSDVINTAGDTLATIYDILKNVGGIIVTVFQAGAVDGFLGSLDRATEKMNAFLKSAEGQKDLKTLFTTLHTVTQGVADALPIVAKVILDVLSAFNSLPEPIRRATALFVGLGVVLGPLVSTITGLSLGVKGVLDVMTLVSNPLGLVVLGLGALAFAAIELNKHVPAVHEQFVKLYDIFKKIADAFSTGFKLPDVDVEHAKGYDFFFKLGQNVRDTVDDIKKAFKDIGKGFELPDLNADALQSSVASGSVDASSFGFRLGQSLEKAVKEHDFKPLARMVGEGFVKSLAVLVEFAGQISVAFQHLIAAIDWRSVGKTGGHFAIDVVLGFAEGVQNAERDPKVRAKLFNAFKDLAVSALDGFLQIVTLGEWDEIKKFFAHTLPDTIVDLVKGALGIHSPSTVFADIGTDVLAGLLGGLVNGLPSALKFFTDLPGEIVDACGDAGTWVKQKGVDAITGLRGGIDDTNHIVVEFFSGLGSNVANYAGDAFSWLRGKGADAIGGLKQGIDSTISTVWDFASNLRNGIVSRVGNFGNILTEAGKDVIRSLITGKDSLISQVWDFAGALRNDIVTRVGNFGNILTEAGKDVIRSLVGGITSMISGGAGTLQDALKKVTDFIPKNKGPAAKDLVLLRPAGQMIMQGLIDGINDQRSALGKTLGSVSNDINSVNGSLVAGQFSVSGNRVVTPTPGTVEAGGGVRNYNLTVSGNYQSQADIVTQFRRMERQAFAQAGKA